jgi:hypothetical protein
MSYKDVIAKTCVRCVAVFVLVLMTVLAVIWMISFAQLIS